MTEQQQHLLELLNQQKKLSSELSDLSSKTNNVRDLLLKVQGAVEYLTQTGVTLPEQEQNNSEEKQSSEED